MEAAGVNVFERLPDELVRNILERVLWSPSDFDSLQKKRLLGVVCKRFRSLIPSMECQELELNNAEDEQKYLQCITGREGAFSLRKLALHIHSPSGLGSILQAVLPASQNSLEEVYLYLGDADPAEQVHWHDVLSMLQHGKKLRLLHVTLWEATIQADAPGSLDFAKPLPVFPVLQSLTLFGFTIPSGNLHSFLESFPALEYLELHHPDVQATHNLELVSLKKAFWWGTMRKGLDFLSPELVTVPRSLGMLLAYLRTGDVATPSPTTYWILGTLERNTLFDPVLQKAIAQFPLGLQTVVEYVRCARSSSEVVGRRIFALRLLSNLAATPENRRAIGGVPGCLERLRECSGRDGEGHIAMSLLAELTLDAEVARVVGGMPEMLGYLLSSLDPYESRYRAGYILLHVTEVAEVRQALARSRENLRKLAGFLDGHTFICVEQQALAVRVLLELGRDGERGPAMRGVQRYLTSQVAALASAKRDPRLLALKVFQLLGRSERQVLLALPGFLEGLVGNLVEGVKLGGMSSWAGHALGVLEGLVADAEVCKTLCGVDGLLPALVGVLETLSDWEQTMAAAVLFQLVKSGGEAEEIARLPGCIPGLVGLLDLPAYCHDGGAARAAAETLLFLSRMISDEASSEIRVAMARNPDLLWRVVDALNGVGLSDEDMSTEGFNERLVDQCLVSLLMCLAEGPQNRKLIVALPGCPQKAVDLIEGTPEMQEVGISLLSRLLADSEVAWRVARNSNVRDRLSKLLD